MSKAIYFFVIIFCCLGILSGCVSRKVGSTSSGPRYEPGDPIENVLTDTVGVNHNSTRDNDE